jgi:hypothetical protein
VKVFIVEPLRGPESKQALAETTYGQVEIAIPGDSGTDLVLVPKDYKPGDSSRYMHKFDRLLTSPLRVEGEFLRDDEMSTPSRPKYVLRVASLEEVPVEAPVALPALTEVAAHPELWDRKMVSYEGTWEIGFEVSRLDKLIWLSNDPHLVTKGKQTATGPDVTSHHVRVKGRLFVKKGARYGHMGGGSMELFTTEMEFLDP